MLRLSLKLQKLERGLLRMVRKVFQKTFVMYDPDQLDIIVNEFRINNVVVATSHHAIPHEGRVLFIAVVYYEVLK